jgi:hypothetical protein
LVRPTAPNAVAAHRDSPLTSSQNAIFFLMSSSSLFVLIIPKRNLTDDTDRWVRPAPHQPSADVSPYPLNPCHS